MGIPTKFVRYRCSRCHIVANIATQSIKEAPIVSPKQKHVEKEEISYENDEHGPDLALDTTASHSPSKSVLVSSPHVLFDKKNKKNAQHTATWKLARVACHTAQHVTPCCQ